MKTLSLPVMLTCGLIAAAGLVRAQSAPVGHEFAIVVQHGKRVSGAPILRVQQGDEITLHVTTDTADEFHLHGYNLLVKLRPNETATLHFIAKLSGRFTYELHKSDLELGALEVYPR
jgi:hypothetical protein